MVAFETRGTLENTGGHVNTERLSVGNEEQNDEGETRESLERKIAELALAVAQETDRLAQQKPVFLKWLKEKTPTEDERAMMAEYRRRKDSLRNQQFLLDQWRAELNSMNSKRGREILANKNS